VEEECGGRVQCVVDEGSGSVSLCVKGGFRIRAGGWYWC